MEIQIKIGIKNITIILTHPKPNIWTWSPKLLVKDSLNYGVISGIKLIQYQLNVHNRDIISPAGVNQLTLWMAIHLIFIICKQ